MKVLLINVTCRSGSTGKIAYDLYSYLRENGHEASVCYGRGAALDEPYILKISSAFEVYFHAFLTRTTGLTSCYSHFATKKLQKIIEQYKPDVVHLHNLHGYYVNMIAIIDFLKTKSIRTIWTLHDENIYTGKCGYSYDCENWLTQCDNCPEKKEYPSSLFFDFTKKMFNDKKRAFENYNNLTIVSPSEWLADRVRQSFLKDKSLCVIPNGIDTDIFKPCDAGALKNKYGITSKRVIVHVSSVFEEERKGGRYVIELANLLPDVQFFIVGNKDAIPDLPGNIIAVGRMENQNELAAYYAMADLFLITSKRENFPTVCLESLCCGTPVVGFTGGGTSETAPDGYGCFVPYGNVSLLEKAVRDIFSGEIKLKNREECAEFGMNHYDKTVMAKQYLALYEESC